MTMVEPALGLRFHVVVDGVSLGGFTGVKGLTVEYEVFEWAEGGQNAYVHRLPGRLKYQNIVLSRFTDRDSINLAAWVEEVRASLRPRTGSITAFDGDGNGVALWQLRGVWPLRYTGPVLDSYDKEMAKETVDLAHHGFTVRTP